MAVSEDRELTVAEFIKKKRKDAGFTQHGLAEELNFSMSYFGRIEAGSAWPSYRAAIMIAEKLGFSPDILINLIEKEKRRRKIQGIQKQMHGRLDGTLAISGASDEQSIKHKLPVLQSVKPSYFEPIRQGDRILIPAEVVVDALHLHYISDPNAFAIHCPDDFLAPKIEKGDMLIISPGDNWDSGDIILAIEEDSIRVGIIDVQDELVFLKPNRPGEAPIIYPRSKFNAMISDGSLVIFRIGYVLKNL